MKRKGSAALLVVLVVVTAARCAMVSVSDAVITADSSRYRDTVDQLSTLRPWEGRGPGVLAQLWFALPLPTALMVQTLVASMLYGVGAWVTVRGASQRLQLPVAIALVTWMLSPWFLLWDAWVLTETGAMAGCFLAAIGAGRFAVRASGPSIMLLGFAVAVAARPFTILVLVPIVAVALLLGRGTPRWHAAVAGFVIMSGLAATHAILFEKGTEVGDGRNIDGIRAASRLFERADHPGYLAAARDHRMPVCDEVDTLLASSESDFLDVWEVGCPEFRTWLDAGGLPWTAELRAEPAATLAGFVDPGDWVERPMSPYWLLDGRFYTASEIFGSAWFPLLRAVNIGMLVASAAAIILAVWPRGRGRRFSLLTVLVCVGVGFVAWATDGLEYWRHVLPSFAVLFPAVIAARTAAPRAVEGAVP